MSNPELDRLIHEEREPKKSDDCGSILVGGIKLMRALIWNRRYLLLVLVGACFNAVRCLFSKIVVESSVHPVLISFAERITIILCSTPAILYHRHSLRMAPVVVALLCTAGLLSAVQIILIRLSYMFLSVADASVIVSCNPVLIGIFGWLFLSEEITCTDICAYGLVITGILALLRPTQLLEGQFLTDHSMFIGFFAAVGAAVSVATGAMIKKILCLKEVEVQVTIFLTNVISMVICAVTCSILGVWDFPSSHFVQGMLLGSGCLGYIGNLTMMIALLRENTYHVSLIGTSYIVLVYILQFIVLSLVPDIYSLLGAGGVALGIILAALRKKQMKNDADDKDEGMTTE